MTPALRLALRLVGRACCRARSEEIEGDLLEFHARRRMNRGLVSAELGVLREALCSMVCRPSRTLLRWTRPLALALAGGGAVLVYVLVIVGLGEPNGMSWPIVALGTALELLFWFLLLFGDRRRVESRY